LLTIRFPGTPAPVAVDVSVLWSTGKLGPSLPVFLYHIFHPRPLKYVPIRFNSFHPFEYGGHIRFYIYFEPFTASKIRDF
jgi:hypothetical protein